METRVNCPACGLSFTADRTVEMDELDRDKREARVALDEMTAQRDALQIKVDELQAQLRSVTNDDLG